MVLVPLSCPSPTFVNNDQSIPQSGSSPISLSRSFRPSCPSLHHWSEYVIPLVSSATSSKEAWTHLSVSYDANSPWLLVDLPLSLIFSYLSKQSPMNLTVLGVPPSDADILLSNTRDLRRPTTNLAKTSQSPQTLLSTKADFFPLLLLVYYQTLL